MRRRKLDNYRIVETKYEDGHSVFYIQEKGIFWGWCDYNQGLFGYFTLEDAENKIKSICDVGVVYHNVK